MTATALRPRYYESNTWFEMLRAMERPTRNGIEMSVVRNDAGITIFTTEDDRIEAYAICRTIEDAYDRIRIALKRNPEYGFFIV